jgi:hypothetical protein
MRIVAWERAAGQLVQAVLTIAVLLVLPSPVRSAMPLAAAGLVCVVVGLILVSRLRPAGRSRWARLRNAVAADVRAGLLHRKALPAVVLASAIVVIGHAVTFLVAARTAGVSAPSSRLLPLAFLVLLAGALPSIAGWGPREGATAWVFAAAGLGATRGAATAAAYGVMVVAASLPGALVLLAGRLSRRRLSSLIGRVAVVGRPEGAADA